MSETPNEDSCKFCDFSSPFPLSNKGDRDEMTNGILLYLKNNQHLLQPSPVKLSHHPPVEYSVQNQYFPNNQNVNPCLALLSLMNNAATNALQTLNSVNTYNNMNNGVGPYKF